MLFLKALGLLPFVAMALAGSSKFADTCQDVDGDGTTLRAQCHESENGQLKSSTLDLNRCIKNNKGKLKCGKNGNYSGSCINCTLRGTAEFSCQCRNSDDDHKYVATTLDLSKPILPGNAQVPFRKALTRVGDKCISNDHGELRC
ncbi:hypothetical protein N7471_005682 [Penicillium samsonianum]|uniref:uncharacterized protein n=1 Tax=Penicillium samsonianum TaxID=1882272 RepID=UPI002548ADFB|nr:uncharacterized protein N7471_005682 [Penicillium samsonianum]KAJ6139196.1 hypothetical protein N7471_005682 [Penicillium samsonianum]